MGEIWSELKLRALFKIVKHPIEKQKEYGIEENVGTFGKATTVTYLVWNPELSKLREITRIANSETSLNQKTFECSIMSYPSLFPDVFHLVVLEDIRISEKSCSVFEIKMNFIKANHKYYVVVNQIDNPIHEITEESYRQVRTLIMEMCNPEYECDIKKIIEFLGNNEKINAEAICLDSFQIQIGEKLIDNTKPKT